MQSNESSNMRVLNQLALDVVVCDSWAISISGTDSVMTSSLLYNRGTVI